MLPNQDLLQKAYSAFNSRDLDGALSFMHEDVVWPNGMEGGTIHGRAGVREYWTRQWSLVDPHVEPVRFTLEPSGRIIVEVYQRVCDLQGKVLLDRMVEHIYRIEDGLIRNMEIREPIEAAS